MSADLFGSDTVVLTMPGISPATLASASVQRQRSDEETEHRERGMGVRAELTVRALVADLPASYQSISDEDWSEAYATVGGLDYAVQEGVIRHGLVKLVLGGELLQERSRAGLRGR